MGGRKFKVQILFLVFGVGVCSRFFIVAGRLLKLKQVEVDCGHGVHGVGHAGWLGDGLWLFEVGRTGRFLVGWDARLEVEFIETTGNEVVRVVGVLGLSIHLLSFN